MENKSTAKKKDKTDVIKKNIGVINQAGFLILALSNKTRQAVLSLLLTKSKFPVQELCKITRTEQSIMSQHLAILRQANLVTTKRDGRFIYYAANKENLKEVLDFAKNVANLTV